MKSSLKFKVLWRKVYPRRSKRDYIKYKEVARVLAKSRIAYYNTLYRFRVNRVAIKNSRSRWGSCSKKGNLNFNYKIALLPAELADYVIVHELCHLQDLNHSKKFWELVGKTIKNYQSLNKKLKKTIIA